MWTWAQIEQLADFDGHGANVMSVYLDLRASGRGQRSYLAAFGNLVAKAAIRLPAAERRTLLQEADCARAWLSIMEVTDRGLVIFSCAAEHLWQREFLSARLPNHLSFQPHVDIEPLLAALEDTSSALRAMVPTLLPHRPRTVIGLAPPVSEIEALARALELQRRLELAVTAHTLASRLDAGLARLRKPNRSSS